MVAEGVSDVTAQRSLRPFVYLYLLYHWVLGVSAPRIQVSDGHELYGRLMCRDELVTNAPVLGIRFILTVRPGSENRGVTTWYQSIESSSALRVLGQLGSWV